MGFIMDGLDAEEYDRQYDDRFLVRRILRYFRPQAYRMAAVSAMIALNTLANTGLPIYISHSIDRLEKHPSTQTIVVIAAITGLLGALAWVFNAIRQSVSAQAVGNVVLHLREDAFDAVLKRDLSFTTRILPARS
jgi:ATP-binding cassette subfamily B protein